MTVHRTWVVAIGVVLLSVACSSNSGTTSSNKTLVVETAFVLTGGIDPAYVAGAKTGTLVLGQMYQGLVQVDQKDTSKIAPDLAESWITSPDALTTTFKLQQNATFSDGTPMTGDDVVFSLSRLQNLKGPGSPFPQLFSGMTVTAPDKYTVVVTLKAPSLSLLPVLAEPQVGILNSKVVKAHGGSDAADASTTDTAQQFLNQQSAGSGPYMLESIDPQSQIVLKASPNYWGPKPTYSKIVFKNVTPDVQALDVQKGTDTVALDLSNSQVSTLDNSQVNIVRVPALEVFMLMLSMNPAVSNVTANINFRQAVRYGIDYQGLLKIAGPGAAQEASVLPTGTPGALPSDQLVTRDVSKATAALAQSGLTNPTVTMEYPTGSAPEGVSYASIAQAIQSNLKDVGITVTLLPETVTELRTKWFAGKSQMFMNAYGGDLFDETEAFFFVPGGFNGTTQGFKVGTDPTLDNLVAQATSATSAAQRADLVVQMDERVNGQAVFDSLFSGVVIIVGHKGIGGLNINPANFVRFWQLT